MTGTTGGSASPGEPSSRGSFVNPRPALARIIADLRPPTLSGKRGECEGTMKLYYHPISPNSHKVLVALYEKGIPFDGEVVNILDPQTKAAYSKDVNVYGKVPFLVRDDGRRIPESTIIVEYLDTYFETGPKLIPTDKELGRQVRFQDRMCDFYLSEPVGLLLHFKQHADVVEHAMSQIKTTLDLLEKHQVADGREFLVGNQFSLADITVAAMTGALGMFGISPEAHPKLSAWRAKIIERPSFQRVLKEAAPYFAALNV
jgi:glutathione S-transferase